MAEKECKVKILNTPPYHKDDLVRLQEKISSTSPPANTPPPPKSCHHIRSANLF